MSNVATIERKSLISTMANRFHVDESKMMATLKATAFKGNVTDEQMMSLLIVARHVVISDSGCWEWVGALSRGYGQLTYKGIHQTAHRFSFANFVEPIKDGLWVLHHCDNRRCVNPDHLYQGDSIDNRADMLDRGRWSHPWAARESCAQGHNYEEGGFYIASDGSRVCRTCQRNHKRAQRAKQKGI